MLIMLILQNGLDKAAEVLQKEAGLPVRAINSAVQPHSTQLYDSPGPSHCVRSSAVRVLVV